MTARSPGPSLPLFSLGFERRYYWPVSAILQRWSRGRKEGALHANGTQDKRCEYIWRTPMALVYFFVDWIRLPSFQDGSTTEPSL